jgi:hypothetical protein
VSATLPFPLPLPLPFPFFLLALTASTVAPSSSARVASAIVGFLRDLSVLYNSTILSMSKSIIFRSVYNVSPRLSTCSAAYDLAPSFVMICNKAWEVRNV